LERLAQEKGPGWIFTDSIPETGDYSLADCTYPFNAAWNLRLNQAVSWAAVFTQTHYLPFLSRAFPTSRWIVAPMKDPGISSRHALGVVAITPENHSILEK